MHVLCLDIGNTTAHVAWFDLDRGVVDRQWAAPTRGLGEPTSPLREALEFAQGHGAAALSWCSVVPAVSAALPAIWAAAGWRLPVFHLSAQNCPGLAIAYPRPNEVGQDRLANALGAQARYGVPAVVIDMGTATTFDVVTTNGYEGGVIAPGLAVMANYLHERTAQLPTLDLTQLAGAPAIGKSTVEAMRAGLATGFAGMIRAILERVLAQLATEGHPAPRVISTGGTALALPGAWQWEIVHDPDITVVGLAEAWRRSTAVAEL